MKSLKLIKTSAFVGLSSLFLALGLFAAPAATFAKENGDSGNHQRDHKENRSDRRDRHQGDRNDRSDKEGRSDRDWNRGEMRE